MSDTQSPRPPEPVAPTPTTEPFSSRRRYDEIDEELLLSLLRPNKDHLNHKFRDPSSTR